MDLGLKGKRVVVLSSSSGIGLGIASVLAKESCSVAICSRDTERLEAARDRVMSAGAQRVLAFKADVSDKSSLEDFFDKVFDAFDSVDILVNNTGGPRPGSVDSLTDDDYLRASQLVLMSKIRASRRVLPGMRRHGWGRIINIESTSVKYSMDNMVLSNVFRSASVAFAKSLTSENSAYGIRVHTLLPGPFLTARVKELGIGAAEGRGITFDQWRQEAEGNTPLKRFGDPLEIGALVAFLSSDVSSYMSGTCIPIDGGILANVS